MIEDMMKYLTDQERLMFQAELNGRRKAATTGVLLCFFLGGVGAHRFYMGQKGLGIVYACFFWTTIPACIALVECFLMPSVGNWRPRTKNQQLTSHPWSVSC